MLDESVFSFRNLLGNKFFISGYYFLGNMWNLGWWMIEDVVNVIYIFKLFIEC